MVHRNTNISIQVHWFKFIAQTVVLPASNTNVSGSFCVHVSNKNGRKVLWSLLVELLWNFILGKCGDEGVYMYLKLQEYSPWSSINVNTRKFLIFMNQKLLEYKLKMHSNLRILCSFRFHNTKSMRLMTLANRVTTQYKIEQGSALDLNYD